MSRRSRRFPRMTVRIHVDYDSGYGQSEGHATTLGAGGLFIEADDTLIPGTVLKVRFTLEEGGSPHEIEGRVIWATGTVRSGHSQKTPGFGVQFTDSVGASKLARELESLAASAQRATATGDISI